MKLKLKMKDDSSACARGEPRAVGGVETRERDSDRVVQIALLPDHIDEIESLGRSQSKEKETFDLRIKESKEFLLYDRTSTVGM